MDIIKLFLLVHKINSELENEDKSICFILNVLSDLFKQSKVKAPVIVGGLTRDLLLNGSWDKIEYLSELRTKRLLLCHYENKWSLPHP